MLHSSLNVYNLSSPLFYFFEASDYGENEVNILCGAYTVLSTELDESILLEYNCVRCHYKAEVMVLNYG